VIVSGASLSPQARYDAAQTTDENTRHWLGADSLGPDAANSYAVRKVLRERSRYETANNPILQGILKTFASDLVGTGPHLQVRLEDDDLNERIERDWRRWCEAVRFTQKLRLMTFIKAQDGETFALRYTNRSAPRDVQMDFYPLVRPGGGRDGTRRLRHAALLPRPGEPSG
jgi:hypothetical protein